MRAALSRLLLAGTAIYAVFCIAGPFRWQEWQASHVELGWLVLTMDGAMLGLCAATTLWVRKAPRTRMQMHIGSAFVVAGCAANAMLSALVLSSVFELVYVPLLAVCVAAVVLSRLYAWLACGFAIATVVTAAFIVSDGDGVLWAGVTAFAGVISAIMVFEGRIISLDRIEALRQKDKGKQLALERAVERAEQELFERVRAEEKSARVEAQRQELKEQLQQAQKLDALGTLAGGIAHDMNNMLAAIRGITEAASLDVEHGSPIQQDLHHILAASDQGASLTRNLLGFARQGKRRSEVFDGEKVARDVMAILQRTAPKRVTLEVVSKCSPGARAAAVGDADQVFHALMNLCLNAIDATEGPAKVEIIVSLVERDHDEVAQLPGGAYLCIAVRDNGHGMDAAVRERIFDPFFSTKGEGHSGLGLSMAYGMAVDHRGRIDIESEPGRGTLVSILLPATSDGEPLTLDTVRPAAVSIDLPVLVIDDEQLLRLSVTRLLTANGVASVEAAGGQEGLDELARQRFAAIVLDLSMPQMDGTECLRRIRMQYPSTPVVLASGYPKGQDVDALLQDGASGFVTKPFCAATLMSALHAAISLATKAADEPLE